LRQPPSKPTIHVIREFRLNVEWKVELWERRKL
jgi:hypothetical protein